jgi:cytochrome c553
MNFNRLALASLACAVQAGMPALAADIEAGKAKVQAVCSACHGNNGISVSDSIPNLAGQRVVYLESQLRALKDGTRKNAVMNAIASQLSRDEIGNVAAYFNSLPGATAATAKSDFLPQLAKANLAFPEGYQASFTPYLRINFPETNQVRQYWVNATALQAAKEGRALPDGSAMIAEVYAAKLDADKKPVMGADGFFVADKLMAYTAMAREAGWGNGIPEMLRNENWNYAAFTATKQARSINQAECLACHKPLDKTSYTFTLEKIVAKARSM